MVVRLLSLLILLLFLHPAPAAEVMISEFMADNQTTVADEDGSYADWVELYNSSTNTVNLQGWHLANRSTNLTQWSFPATNLNPGSFLLVFASGKDRRVPGAPLHTSFKLSKAGEYLALVMPDGVTKASEFAPAFPPQYTDVSYGYVMTGAVTTLIASNASARALVPLGDLGASWKQTSFDDSVWTAGTLGVGYDATGNYSPAIGLDIGSSMFGVNSSAYLRIPFNIVDPRAFNLLTLNLRYDDGFVAYMNGVEVLRRNAPVLLAWNSFATASHGAPSPGALNEAFEAGSSNYTWSQYGAAPGPSIQPAGANSTGKFLRLLYDGTNDSANALTFRQTAPGLFQSIIADFDFRLTSSINSPADGFAFMLIPTSLYGTNGPGVNTALVAVEQPNYQGVFGVGFRVYPHASVNNVSAHWDGARIRDVTMPKGTIDLAAGVFHHAQISLQHTNGGAIVTVTLTRNINGTPGIPYSPIINLFIPGLNPFDCRVQFGARTGGLTMNCDLDNCNVQFLPPKGPIAFENFEFSPFSCPLVAGQNLLAIQGLNVVAGSSNFLIQPELLGRELVVTEPAGYLYPATPGGWNGGANSAIGPPPVAFWPSPGVYATNTLTVSLAASSSATIRYTLDGSTPGTNSPIYVNPILLATNCTIRARADLNGIPGPVTAANYVLLDPSVTNFSSNLPLVIIDTLGQTIPDGSKIGAYAVFIETNAISGRAALSGTPDYIGRLGIGLHGSSSLGFPKQPYTIELDDEKDSSINDALLTFPPGSDWVLKPPYADKTFVNDMLTEQTFSAMGHYAIRCRYVELFLHRNPGRLAAKDYQGIYLLEEHIRVDENRVNIAKLGPTDNSLPAVTGGYIFAKDKIQPNADLTFTTSSGQELVLRYPKSDDATKPQLDYLTSYINAFEAELYGTDWRDPVNGYANYIDVDSFVDYHWIVEYSKNIDGIRISDFMNKDRDGKIKMGPIWDWDLSWGNANYLQGGNTNGWYYSQLGDGDDLWLHRLRTDPDFYQKIIDRWGALRANLFHPTNLFSRIDQITNYLWEAQARDFATWPRLGTYVWPNPNGGVDGFDVDYVSPTTYDGIISQFKKFVLGRYLWIDQQFVPAPTLATNGASLSLSAPLGAIYYTLDGTDPRLRGGGLNASARSYVGAMVLTNNAAIFARTFFTNAWSPPTRALYLAALPALRITEINYHPSPPPPGSPYSSKDFEFIEVQNTGTNTINLAGAHLGGGIDFTFAPGEWTTLGTPTSNDFDTPGTPLVASVLGQGPGPYLNNAGLNGTVLRVLESGTNASRNRFAFDQTATGICQRIIANFDFRALTSFPPGTNGAATLQNFDAPGTSYTLAHNGPTAPTVMSPDVGSDGSFLRLVPLSGSEGGTIAFNRSAPGVYRSIVAEFDFRITPPTGAPPADGLGFALLNTSTYGANGAVTYFAEEPNLAGSIGVGFDAYNNASTPQEPNNNHISLHWNGAQVGNAVTPSFLMSNGKFHRAQIIVEFSGGSAFVTARLTPDIRGVAGPTETVLQYAAIPGVTPYESRLAFGARTGGQWATHDLDNVNVLFSQNSSAAGGLSLVFLPTDRFGAKGAGSGLADYADWPSASNVLAMDLAFHPSNLFNDASLYWNRALAASAAVSPALVDLDNGAFHHARLEVDAASAGAFATLTLSNNVSGLPSQPVNVFSNLFMPGVTLGNTRVEFAARNGGVTAAIDLDNTGIAFQSLSPLLLNPGESILVVHDLAAFESRYGTGLRVAGEFSGSLNDSGERLTLSGPLGEPILDFAYDPAWYPLTDGGGFSLVMVDPQAPPDSWGLPSNWRPSGEAGGSPGTVDPVSAPPALGISISRGNQTTLEWSANSGAYDLYSADILDPLTGWAAVTNTPVLSGNLWSVVLSATNRTCFYRLQRRFP